jgi:hypothetical protein
MRLTFRVTVYQYMVTSARVSYLSVDIILKICFSFNFEKCIRLLCQQLLYRYPNAVFCAGFGWQCRTALDSAGHWNCSIWSIWVYGGWLSKLLYVKMPDGTGLCELWMLFRFVQCIKMNIVSLPPKTSVWWWRWLYQSLMDLSIPFLKGCLMGYIRRALK